MTSGILIIILTIICAGIFSGMETGSYTLNRVRLHFNLDEGRRGANLLALNLKSPQLFIFTTLVCHNLFVYIASMLATGICAKSGIAGHETEFLWDFFPWSAEIAATFALMLPLFIFGEIGPKNLFRTRAETLMYSLAPLQRFCILVCLPITWPLKLVASALTSSSKKDLSREMKDIDAQMLRYFFAESTHEGVISDRENKMINRTLAIHTLPIKEVMLALDKAASLSGDSSPDDCLPIYHDKEIERIPVYKDRKENIVGIINFFDALQAKDAGETIGAYIKDIVRLDIKCNMQEAFYKLQRKKELIALVVDGTGKSQGIIRLKDIVRHITGN